MLYITLALLLVLIILLLWKSRSTNEPYTKVSPVRLQISEDIDHESKGFLRANFTPTPAHPRKGNWTPWRHESATTPYYWYDAPHKTPGHECLDSCYHRYDRVGCTNACRNMFNIN